LEGSALNPAQPGSTEVALPEAEDRLRAAKLEQLWRDIQEGLHSGPARPWSVSELKREGRKRLATRTGSGRK
jgi:hypothetical protein